MHDFHLGTWKLVFAFSKLNLPRTPISVKMLGRLPGQAWLKRNSNKIGGLRDQFWRISSIFSIIFTIYIILYLTKQFLISKSDDLSLMTVFFFVLHTVIGTVAVMALGFTRHSGNLHVNIRSYYFLHQKCRGLYILSYNLNVLIKNIENQIFLAINRTTAEQDRKFFFGLKTTLILSAIFCFSFPPIGFVFPFVTSSIPIAKLTQDTLEAVGISPSFFNAGCQKFIFQLAKALLNLTIFGNWGLVSVNMTCYIIWYIRFALDLLDNLENWTLKNICSKKPIAGQSQCNNKPSVVGPVNNNRRKKVWHSFKADAKLHLFCRLYSEAAIGISIFNDFVKCTFSAVLFGSCSMAILSAYGAIRFSNEAHFILQFTFIFGLVLIVFLTSAVIPAACKINYKSSNVLYFWGCYAKSKTASQQIKCLQPLKVIFEPFFYGHRSTTLTITSVCIDMLVNMLLYKSSFDD